MESSSGDKRDPTGVVREIHDWFQRVPFEPARQILGSAGDWETATTRFEELGYPTPDLIDPEIEIPPEGIAGLRDEAGFVGQDGWFRFWAAWFEPWAEYEWEITHWEEIGDHVVLEGVNRAVGRESGAPVEWRNAQVWTVRGGKVIRVVGYETLDEALVTVRSE
jgi:hypothetical protein